MNFSLFPTVSSGLDVSTYTVRFPAPRQWSIVIPRLGSSATVLDGSAAHTFVAKDVTQATPVYEQQVEEATYQALRVLDENDETSWILAAENRLFEVGIDITGCERVQRYGRIMRELVIAFKIVREISI